MVHLIHPALVHFPIALLLVGSSSEAFGLLRGHAGALRWGGALTVAGTIALLPTIVSGYVAAKALDVPDGVEATLDLHELCGLAAAGIYTGLLFWKAWNRGAIADEHKRFYALLLALGAVAVAGGALIGGRLVYVHGLGVGS